MSKEVDPQARYDAALARVNAARDAAAKFATTGALPEWQDVPGTNARDLQAAYDEVDAAEKEFEAARAALDAVR
ncbi:hypothetical protein ACFYST_08165 [Kitasatospora sp. NPDC004614]|uniref:hypothetical protein n=1 Tax=unclassified Kitasatospora TaxID=2633591 RepID=UPI003699BD5E